MTRWRIFKTAFIIFSILFLFSFLLSSASSVYAQTCHTCEVSGGEAYCQDHSYSGACDIFRSGGSCWSPTAGWYHCERTYTTGDSTCQGDEDPYPLTCEDTCGTTADGCSCSDCMDPSGTTPTITPTPTSIPVPLECGDICGEFGGNCLPPLACVDAGFGDDICLNPNCPPENQTNCICATPAPPDCTSLAASDTSVIRGESITLTASAQQGTSTISYVRMYYASAPGICGSSWVIIGNDTTSPYSLVLNTADMFPGQYTIAANVVDSSGAWCTGNPGGDCGTDAELCTNCSTTITVTAPDLDCGDICGEFGGNCLPPLACVDAGFGDDICLNPDCPPENQTNCICATPTPVPILYCGYLTMDEPIIPAPGDKMAFSCAVGGESMTPDYFNFRYIRGLEPFSYIVVFAEQVTPIPGSNPPQASASFIIPAGAYGAYTVECQACKMVNARITCTKWGVSGY